MTGRQDSRPARDEAGVVAPSRVMLVAIVLVAVAAVTYIAGLGSGSDDATDTASTASARSAASSAPADPSTSASASPSASPSATASTKATTKASPSPTAAASSAAPAVQRGQVRVSVFNNSSTTGLGARTSDKVKGAGWKVLGTDNWYGTIPEPTVYYPASLQAAAKMLAKDVGIDRVKPAVAPMRSDRLTLIVTSDYRA